MKGERKELVAKNTVFPTPFFFYFFAGGKKKNSLLENELVNSFKP